MRLLPLVATFYDPDRLQALGERIGEDMAEIQLVTAILRATSSCWAFPQLNAAGVSTQPSAFASAYSSGLATIFVTYGACLSGSGLYNVPDWSSGLFLVDLRSIILPSQKRRDTRAMVSQSAAQPAGTNLRTLEIRKFAGSNLIAIFGSLLSFGLVAGPASAGTLMLDGTVWSVTFPNSVNLIFNTNDRTNGTSGTLIEITTRTNNDSITLLFQQMFETPTSTPASAGLRLNFQKTDTNVVDADWIGYNLQLFDDVPLLGADPINAGDHPPEPHFHPDGVAPTAATFTFGGPAFSGNELGKYSSSFKGDAATRDPADLIQLGFDGRKVIKNRSVQIQNLLIHERQFAIGVIPDPGRRTFRLVETPIPIPEPRSLWLSGIGVAMLGLCSWLGRGRSSRTTVPVVRPVMYKGYPPSSSCRTGTIPTVISLPAPAPRPQGCSETSSRKVGD
jgi:hypothetical protein